MSCVTILRTKYWLIYSFTTLIFLWWLLSAFIEILFSTRRASVLIKDFCMCLILRRWRKGGRWRLWTQQLRGSAGRTNLLDRRKAPREAFSTSWTTEVTITLTEWWSPAGWESDCHSLAPAADRCPNLPTTSSFSFTINTSKMKEVAKMAGLHMYKYRWSWVFTLPLQEQTKKHNWITVCSLCVLILNPLCRQRESSVTSYLTLFWPLFLCPFKNVLSCK